jgi:hypothetical protein
MARNGLGAGADHLAYPKGAYTPAQLAIYFRSARTIGSLSGPGPVETFPPSNPLRLRSISINDTHTPAQVATWVTQATNRNQWLMLTFHDIQPDAGPFSSIQIATTKFAAKIANITGQAGPAPAVRTVGDQLRQPLP